MMSRFGFDPADLPSAAELDEIESAWHEHDLALAPRAGRSGGGHPHSPAGPREGDAGGETFTTTDLANDIKQELRR